MRKTNLTHRLAFPKPFADQHAKRLAQKRKYDKPEFDPREADRWIDADGKFTIPHTKGK